MTIDWNLVAKICDEQFFSDECSGNSLRDWLAASIESWIESGKIVSFHPFEDFFPDTEREEKCLAAIGNNLRRKKRKNESFSPKYVFSRALTDILTKKNFYIHNVEAWQFALRTAREMALDETVATLTRLIGYDEFRRAHNEEGYNLFQEAFDAVEAFGPAGGTLEFWNACRAHIDEYPHLSLRLLVNLIQADRANCQYYVGDSKMIRAIIDYRDILMMDLNTWNLPEFDIAAEQISDTLNDDLYHKFFDACVHKTDYLIIKSRMERIGTRESCLRLGRSYIRPVIKPVIKNATPPEFPHNIRQIAGETMAQENPAFR